MSLKFLYYLIAEIPATDALCPKGTFPNGLQTTKNLSNAITAMVLRPVQPIFQTQKIKVSVTFAIR